MCMMCMYDTYLYIIQIQYEKLFALPIFHDILVHLWKLVFHGFFRLQVLHFKILTLRPHLE